MSRNGAQTGALAILAAIPFVMTLGNSMFVPILPLMQRRMDLTPLETGLIITAFSVPGGLLIPVAGFLADRFGRRAVMVPALIIFAAGGVLAGLAPLLMKQPYPLFLAGRALQGVGVAGTGPIALAMAGDLFQQQARSRAMGVLEAANNLGKVTAPILGVLAALIVWFAPLFVYAVFALPAAALVWWGLKGRGFRPEKPRSVASYGRDLLAVLRAKGGPLAGVLLGGAVVLFLWFGVLFYFSDVIDRRLKFHPAVRGLIFAAPVLAMSVTSYLTGTFAQRRLNVLKWVVGAGLGLLAGVLVALGFTQQFGWLFAAVALLGVGAGLVLPSLNLLATSAVPEAERGMVTAVYGAVRFLGVALGPPVFGTLLGVGTGLTFFSAAGLATGVLAASLWLIDLRRLLPRKLLRARPDAEAGTGRERPREARPEGGWRRRLPARPSPAPGLVESGTNPVPAAAEGGADPAAGPQAVGPAGPTEAGPDSSPWECAGLPE